MSEIVLEYDDSVSQIVRFANQLDLSHERLNQIAEKIYQWANKLDTKKKYTLCHGNECPSEEVAHEFLPTLNLTFMEYRALTEDYEDGASDFADMKAYVKMRLGIKKRKRVVKVEDDD